VAASVAVLLGLCLPVLLAVALSEETRTGVLTQLEHAREWSGVFGFLFVLNFWAASLTGNIVRGVLTTILTCFALGGSASLAVWITEQLGGLETPLFRLLIVRFQVPLDIFNESNWMWRIVTVGLVSFVIVVFLVALGQSRRCFRRAQTYEAIPVRQPLVLVLSGFLISFWAADLSVSANNSYQSLRVELSSLAQSLRLRASDFPSPGQKPRRITLEQFEDASRPIPAHIKQWLRNATVALYQKPKADHPSIQNVPAFWVDVSFASTPSDNLHVESIPWDVRQQ
jgi:hypothetical protein